MPDSVQPDPESAAPETPVLSNPLTPSEAETLAAFKHFLGTQHAMAAAAESHRDHGASTSSASPAPPPMPAQKDSLWGHVCKAYNHGHGHTATKPPEPPKPPKPRRLSIRERIVNVFTGGVNGLPDDES